MTTTHSFDSTRSSGPVLYFALELSWQSWKLAFTVGRGQKPRIRTIAARNTAALLEEIQAAKRRFNLPDETPVSSCYEAGRDGFWIDRLLRQDGVDNIVVDSSSIEVNRRKRRAKSDRLDAEKLVDMLIRWHDGDKKVWAVVHVPSAEAEDRRQLHRDLIALKTERTAHVNGMKGLLATLGLTATIDDQFPQQLEEMNQWDGSGVPAGMRERLLREFERLQLLQRQIAELEKHRAQLLVQDQSPEMEQVKKLMRLKGIGINGAWLLVWEFFAWRTFRNRRQLGSLSGLTPTPYSSGDCRREQGISKAGNRLVRWMMVQLGWCWLHYQPQSALSQWYQRRFGGGTSRVRRIGIVAVARKLLVALWKYLETGEVPAGAILDGATPARATPAKAVRKIKLKRVSTRGGRREQRAG
jgi:transposase